MCNPAGQLAGSVVEAHAELYDELLKCYALIERHGRGVSVFPYATGQYTGCYVKTVYWMDEHITIVCMRKTCTVAFPLRAECNEQHLHRLGQQPSQELAW